MISCHRTKHSSVPFSLNCHQVCVCVNHHLLKKKLLGWRMRIGYSMCRVIWMIPPPLDVSSNLWRVGGAVWEALDVHPGWRKPVTKKGFEMKSIALLMFFFLSFMLAVVDASSSFWLLLPGLLFAACSLLLCSRPCWTLTIWTHLPK